MQMYCSSSARPAFRIHTRRRHPPHTHAHLLSPERPSLHFFLLHLRSYAAWLRPTGSQLRRGRRAAAGRIKRLHAFESFWLSRDFSEVGRRVFVSPLLLKPAERFYSWNVFEELGARKKHHQSLIDAGFSCGSASVNAEDAKNHVQWRRFLLPAGGAHELVGFRYPKYMLTPWPVQRAGLLTWRLPHPLWRAIGKMTKRF